MLLAREPRSGEPGQRSRQEHAERAVERHREPERGRSLGALAHASQAEPEDRAEDEPLRPEGDRDRDQHQRRGERLADRGQPLKPEQVPRGQPDHARRVR